MDLDLILLDVEAKDEREIITKLGSRLLKKQYVKDTYVDAVLKREATLPTGLDIGEFCVAIPHTDSGHVNHSAFSVGILREPVKFHSMIDPGNTIDAQIVFLLAVKDPDGQVDLLQSLMSVFQDIELLKAIKNSDTKEKVASLLDFIKV